MVYPLNVSDTVFSFSYQHTVTLQCCVSFCYTRKNQTSVYIYPFTLRPPSHPTIVAFFFFNLFSESPGSTSWATLSFPCWLFHSILPNSVHLFSVYHHFIGDVHLAPSLHWQLLNVCLKPASHWQSRSPFKLPHGGQSCLVCISNSTCSMTNPCILPARISPLPLLISINATSLLSGSLNWSSQTFFSSQQTSI